MRCLILAHGLRAGGGVVVGQNLIREMLAISNRDEWLCIVPAAMGYEQIVPNQSNCHVLSVKFKNVLHRLLFDHFRLQGILDHFKPDIILVLGNIGLSGKLYQQAVFLHQSQLVYDSRHYGKVGIKEKLRYAYLKWRFKQQLTSTTVIFCQTPLMHKRIINQYGYCGRVEVVGTAVDASFGKNSTAIKRVSKTTEFKLLYLTRYYTHKNIEILIQVFDQFRDRLSGVKLYLTIAPDQHRNAAKILHDIHDRNLENMIINLGPVDKADLDKTYAMVDAVIIPTLLESFGITYIEAMIAAKPILTSDLDFAHEQCDKAALYFDPWNPAELCDRILQLKEQAELQDLLIHEGLKRLSFKRYQWADIGRSMHDTLSELVG